jgi:predicted transcriptional regulator
MDTEDRKKYYKTSAVILYPDSHCYREEIGMRNRQKDEIMRDILYSAQGGAGITKIMFHAYLTHSQAKEYTQALINSALLEQDVEAGSLRQFRTTPKGVEYLGAVERMSDMLAIETRRAAKPTTFLL